MPDGLRYFINGGKKEAVKVEQGDAYTQANPSAVEVGLFNLGDGKKSAVRLDQLPAFLNDNPNAKLFNRDDAPYLSSYIDNYNRTLQQRNAQNTIYSGETPAGVPYAPGLVFRPPQQQQLTPDKPFPVPQDTPESKAKAEEYRKSQEGRTFLGDLANDAWQSISQTPAQIDKYAVEAGKKVIDMSAEATAMAPLVKFALKPATDWLGGWSDYFSREMEAKQAKMSDNKVTNFIGGLVPSAVEMAAVIAMPELSTPYLISMGMQSGGSQMQQYEKRMNELGQPVNDDVKIAVGTLTGAVEALSEGLGTATRYTKGLFKTLTGKNIVDMAVTDPNKVVGMVQEFIAKNPTKLKVLLETGKQAAKLSNEEGLEEVASTLGQAIVNGALYDKDAFKGIGKDMLMSYAGGVALGGLFGAGTNVRYKKSVDDFINQNGYSDFAFTPKDGVFQLLGIEGDKIYGIDEYGNLVEKEKKDVSGFVRISKEDYAKFGAKVQETSQKPDPVQEALPEIEAGIAPTVHEDGLIHPVKVKGNEEKIVYVVKGDEKGDPNSPIIIYDPETGQPEMKSADFVIPSEGEYKTPEQAINEQARTVRLATSEVPKFVTAEDQKFAVIDGSNPVNGITIAPVVANRKGEEEIDQSAAQQIPPEMYPQFLEFDAESNGWLQAEDTTGEVTGEPTDQATEQPAPQATRQEPAYPLDKNGQPDIEKMDEFQLFNYNKETFGEETAIEDAKGDLKLISDKILKAQKKLETSDTKIKIKTRLEINALNERKTKLEGLIQQVANEAPAVPIEATEPIIPEANATEPTEQESLTVEPVQMPNELNTNEQNIQNEGATQQSEAQTQRENTPQGELQPQEVGEDAGSRPVAQPNDNQAETKTAEQPRVETVTEPSSDGMAVSASNNINDNTPSMRDESQHTSGVFTESPVEQAQTATQQSQEEKSPVTGTPEPVAPAVNEQVTGEGDVTNEIQSQQPNTDLGEAKQRKPFSEYTSTPEPVKQKPRFAGEAVTESAKFRELTPKQPSATPEKEGTSQVKPAYTDISDLQQALAEKKINKHDYDIEAERLRKEPTKPRFAGEAVNTIAINNSNLFNTKSFREFSTKLASGEISISEFKQAFETLLSSKDNITAELNGMTKAQLLDGMTAYGKYRYKNEKKDYIVKALWDDYKMTFVFGTFSYTHGENVDDVLSKRVSNTTQEDIDKYVEENKKRIEEYKKRVRDFKKAITNPETLEEFRTFIKEKGLSSLTPEQKANYDLLVTQTVQDKRKTEKDQKATITKVDLGSASMSVIPTKHTKTGQDLFVVQLSDRVERSVYDDLNSKAKKLGGYYSSFRGNGAVPGFQFKTQEQADKFIALQNDNVSNIDSVEQKQEEKIQNRAAKLRENAERMIEAADNELNRDRLTNTAKRAREAGYADDKANESKRMAQTMLNIADAIDNGDVKLLSGVKAKTHIELLESIINSARHKEIKAQLDREPGKRYDELRHEPATLATVEYLGNSYYPSIYERNIKDLVNESLDTPGVKLIASRWNKKIAGLKDGENYQLKSDQDVQDIFDMFNAIPQREKDYNRIGDDLANHKRMKAMGIENDSMLREAVREYIQYRGKKSEGDKVKQLERALVGRSVGFDFFPTPKSVANRMVNDADINDGMDVLEPSAGTGNIADAIKETGISPDVIELSSELKAVLEAKGYNIVGEDFMDYSGKKYDRIVMNPPFSNGLDGDHVRHAYELLKPDGRVVAIVGQGTLYRSDKKSVAFRDWLDSVGASIEELPQGTFNDKTLLNTTGANASLVVIDKNDTVGGNKPLYSIIGERGAQGIDSLVSNLNVAKQMTEAGEDAKTIFLATGWEKFPDGWKYDLPDNIGKFVEQFESLNQSGSVTTNTISLGELMGDVELFKLYPELKDVRVTKQNSLLDMFKSIQGWYSPDTNTLNITPYSKDKSSTLLHEVQHVIQKIEGFFTGGSTELVVNSLPENVLKDISYKIISYHNSVISRESKALDDLKGFEQSLSDKDIDFIERIHKLRIKYKTEQDELYPIAKAKNPGENPFINDEGMKKIGKKIDDLKEELRDFFAKKNPSLKYNISDTFFYGIDGLKMAITEASEKVKSSVEKISKINRATTRDELIDALGKEASSYTYDSYKKIAGEVEARNVQSRLSLTDQQRKQQLLSETQDVAEDQKIYIQNAINNAYSISTDPIRNAINEDEKYNAVKNELESIVKDMAGSVEISVSKNSVELLNQYASDGASKEDIDIYEAYSQNSIIPGFYFNNKIYVDASSINDSIHLAKLVIHENVHAGLKRMFGANLPNIDRNVFIALGEKEIASVVPPEYFIKANDITILGEEYITHTSERMYDTGFDFENIIPESGLTNIANTIDGIDITFVERLVNTVVNKLYNGNTTQKQAGNNNTIRNENAPVSERRGSGEDKETNIERSNSARSNDENGKRIRSERLTPSEAHTALLSHKDAIDAAKTLDERHNAIKAFVDEMKGVGFDTTTVVSKTIDDMINAFSSTNPPAEHLQAVVDESKDNLVEAFRYKGAIYICSENIHGSERAFLSFFHEINHEGLEKSGENPQSIYNEFGEDFIKSVVPAEYWDDTQRRLGFEFTAALTEKALYNSEIFSKFVAGEDVTPLVSDYFKSLDAGEYSNRLAELAIKPLNATRNGQYGIGISKLSGRPSYSDKNDAGELSKVTKDTEGVSSSGISGTPQDAGRTVGKTRRFAGDVINGGTNIPVNKLPGWDGVFSKSNPRPVQGTDGLGKDGKETMGGVGRNNAVRFAGDAIIPDRITVDGVERPTRNSNGKYIYPTKQGIENFWKWFSDSKVVDESGKPLVVYHGTLKDFNSFDISKTGQNSDSGMWGSGFYFSSSPQYAETYAKRNNKTGSIIPVYLAINDPLVINNSDEIPTIKVPNQTVEDLENGATNYSEKFRDFLINNNHDGVIAYGDEYVALNPTQIKSATGNDGSFSPEDESILLSKQLWHGSPHSFDKFSLDKIGTGEGAQAFGYGIYFTNKKSIAEDYANKLYGKYLGEIFTEQLNNPDQNIDLINDAFKEMFINDFGKEDVIEFINKQDKYTLQEKNNLINVINEQPNKSIYSVTIHSGKETGEYDYLRWDKPVTDEQFGKIYQSGEITETYLHRSDNVLYNGEMLYKALSQYFNSDKVASEFLLRAGIDGIEYPAIGGTGGKDGDAMNYVVFDDNAITIDEHIQFSRQIIDGTPQNFSGFKLPLNEKKQGMIDFRGKKTDDKPIKVKELEYLLGAEFELHKPTGSIYGYANNKKIRLSNHPSKFSERLGSNSLDLNYDVLSVTDMYNRIMDINPFENLHTGDIIHHRILGEMQFISHDKDKEVVEVKNKDGVIKKYYDGVFTFPASNNFNNDINKPPKPTTFAGDYLNSPEFSKRSEAIKKSTVQTKRDMSAMGEKLVTGFDKFLSYAADQDLALKNFQEGVKKLGGTVSKDNDAYQIITTLSSRNAREAYYFNKDYFEPLETAVVNLTRDGSEAWEVTRYMKAKRSLEREDNEGLQSLNPDPNHAWSRPNVEKYVNDFEAKHPLRLIFELWDANKKAQTRIIDIAEEAGKISSRYADNMRNRAKYYVPLRGWTYANPETQDPTQIFEYEHEEPNYQELQMTAEGRGSEAGDPLAYTRMLAISAIHSASRNKLKQRVLNLWRENKDIPGIEKYVYVKNTYEELMDDGTWVEKEGIPTVAKMMNGAVRLFPEYTGNKKRITQQQAGENELSVYEKGRKIVLIFQDPEMKRVLTGRNQIGQELLDSKFVQKYMADPIQYWKQLTTQWNPNFFLIRNPVRDLMGAVPSYWVTGGSMIEYIKDVSLADKHLARVFFENGTDTSLDKLTQLWLDRGGMTMYATMEDVHRTAKSIKKELSKLNDKIAFEDLIAGKADNLADIIGGTRNAAGRAVKKWLDFASMWGENRTRLGIFLAEIAKNTKYDASKGSIWDQAIAEINSGRNIDSEVLLSKEISGNFPRRGRISGLFGKFYPFWNPPLQSAYKHFNMAKDNPKRFGLMMAGIASMGFLWQMLLNALMGDDEYNKLKWRKYATITFPVGDYNISLPMGFVWNLPWSIGAGAYNVAKGFLEPQKYAMETASNLIQTVTPFSTKVTDYGSMDMVRPFVPWALTLPYDISTNSDWSGKTIYNESPFNQNKPDSWLGKKNVNPILDETFKGLNEATGGNEFRKGWLDWNPSKVEHTIQFIFSGLGKFGTQVANLAVDKDLSINEIPIIYSFVSKDSEQSNYIEYKILKDKIEKYHSEIKNYEKNNMTKELNKYRDSRMDELYDYYSDINKDLKEMWDNGSDAKQREEKMQILIDKAKELKVK